jgi:hypothetical protein
MMTGLTQIEATLYTVSGLFLVPVLLLIAVSLVYALASMGIFLQEIWQRTRKTYQSRLVVFARLEGDQGYKHSDDLELWIMQRLEKLRIVARATPMLGLIATMIPMGPALLALTSNDAATVGQNMVVAFSSVILALIAASISYVILTVRRRWLLQELRHIELSREPG